MARIRTIKPEFWSDDTITECSLSARLLFIGIWNFADDAGNLDRSAKQIKARVFPVDNVDCEPLICELIAHGLLTEYSVSEKKYLHIPGFAEHQLINRPSKPVCPPYPDSRTPHVTLTEPSVSTHSGREGKGSKGSKGYTLTEPSAPTPTHAKPPRSPRAKSARTPFPEDLPEATEAMRTQALQRYPDCDVGEMFLQFRAHHVSHDSRLASWTQAWVTWVGNAEKFGYPRARINGTAREAPIFR